jgi:hypothetical protein
MLALVGRAADGWVPSLGYVKPGDLDEMNRRIDDDAESAGRDPRSIRRVLNVGADLPAELFVSLTVERGMDTYVIGGDDAVELRRFASEVIPRVREGVTSAR